MRQIVLFSLTLAIAKIWALCSDECFKANDQVCDDHRFCVYGTDCTDCGPRGVLTKSPTFKPSAAPRPSKLYISETTFAPYSRRPTTRSPVPTYFAVDDPELPPATAKPRTLSPTKRKLRRHG